MSATMFSGGAGNAVRQLGSHSGLDADGAHHFDRRFSGPLAGPKKAAFGTQSAPLLRRRRIEADLWFVDYLSGDRLPAACASISFRGKAQRQGGPEIPGR